MSARERIAREAREAAWFADVKARLVPMLRDSALYLGICPDGEPDAKFCVELGVAIMLDKPLLIVVPPGRRCPPGLDRIAHVVLADCDLARPEDRKRLQVALETLGGRGGGREQRDG